MFGLTYQGIVIKADVRSFSVSGLLHHITRIWTISYKKLVKEYEVTFFFTQLKNTMQHTYFSKQARETDAIILAPHNQFKYYGI